jgi:hypothetical protein
MDTRREALVGEIARLEQALVAERDALRRAGDGRRRQALRLNLAAAHEALGDLYRRLHALDTAGTVGDGLLYIIDRSPHAWDAR